MSCSRRFALVACSIVTVACSSSSSSPSDAGTHTSPDSETAHDARSPGKDGGHLTKDAAATSKDAHTGTKDAPSGGNDAGGPACNSLPAPAATIVPTFVNGTAPAATGGTIVDGTYHATAEVIYVPGDAGTIIADLMALVGSERLGFSLELSGSTSNVASSQSTDGGVTATRSTGTFETSGDTVTTTSTCPPGDAGAGKMEQYSATSTQIIIYEPLAGPGGTPIGTAAVTLTLQ